jgi:hypothetical protein
LEPAGEGQSLSAWQADVVPVPASPLLLPIGTHAGTPFAPPPRRQTNDDGQPLVEQSPEWHWLSAPQLPLVQSEGFVQAFEVPVDRQVPSVVQTDPLGH